ncbi:phage tail sheath C-terminal domain-containing protein [Sporosarcina sp. FSL K6-1522]|uniref:phage tail sheath C-terminal domain-containing protein n=1 Tax=Sporosarcina sp. FSL K6-1522 TaxID=2921554 RepID=UPI00315A2BF8
MGLPKININFFGKLKGKPKRSSAGIVALILKDDTQTGDTFVYKPDEKIEGWTTDNVNSITQSLAGGASKVIVERVGTTPADYKEALGRLRNKRFDYLAIPGIQDAETQEIVEWIKARRKKDRKRFKAVLPNTAANHESIIDFTAEEIKIGDKDYTTAAYTARIAGVLAGLPFNRSSTYFVLDEVTAVKEIDDPDAAVDNGELILINDGEKIKIGRGVNSLKTITPEDEKNEEFKSIRVVEILDMIHDEIYDNFNDNYIGKVPNIYDNQVLFLNEINRGFTELEGLELLDPNAENAAWVDVDSQRVAWDSAGVDISDWDDDKVKESAFKRHVFLAGKVRVVDTIEDLDFNIEI